ncbi:MAG: hypothetical protein H6R41_43 [Deltaproteobacteria bacterium]|nr:hypothetical protein [Deltaproteobacteria bacterium]MBS1243506.1 hypothetical protein [Deltaproteobacteria bacterium]
MTRQIDELIEAIRTLEEELQEEFRRKREEFRFTIEERRVRFAEELILQHRRLKVGLLRYLREARLPFVLTAPVIYAGIVPLLFLDLFISLYQAICFPVYGIPKARRGDYLLFDREDLPYLNALEKINCAYCSYANGLAAWFREVAARTEQYWCPIKHARRIRDAHSRYPRFFEYGDAESYRKGLERLQKEYKEKS